MRCYFAGPDLFFPGYEKFRQATLKWCAGTGIDPIFPIDGEVEPASNISAPQIAQSNMMKISTSTLVIANLAPFRGFEPDSGTIFEVGFACARGIPVIGYLPDCSSSMISRLSNRVYGIEKDEAGIWRDPSGAMIEDFSLPLNLMVSTQLHTITDSLENAIKAGARMRPMARASF